ncbi:TRAP transporter small permease [Aquamicrobium sp. LC103]|uniref:TRAP transporter small permease n=1 Tax=Aquamicrobium sp. LC103 TaxID=1120658 RepID=UPI00069C376D|nr:TRAP transporter small permease [Aquamicrobium sp. LC103]TKT74416.1 TRAP transporter small permease [Aquamicrobium sp. LC103]
MDGSNIESLNTPEQNGAIARILSAASLALRLLRRVVDAVAITLLCAMVFLILAQVLGRYALNYSISWSEESATFAQIWLVMLGAGIAMRNRHHVAIDVIVARCPIFVQRIVKGAGFILAAWFLVVVIIGSFSLLALGFIVRSPALQLPLALPYFALPTGMAYFLLEFALATLPEIRDPSITAANQGGEIE